MLGILANLLVGGLAVMAGSYIIPGVQVRGFFDAIIAALLIGVVNALVKPVLLLLTLPLNILTLGLFTFVINALMILLVSALLPGFNVEGFLPALLLSLVLSIISSVLGGSTKS